MTFKNITFLVFLVGALSAYFYQGSVDEIVGTISAFFSQDGGGASGSIKLGTVSVEKSFSEDAQDGTSQTTEEEKEEKVKEAEEVVKEEEEDSKIEDVPPKSRPHCEDKENDCNQWADLGECEANPKFMLVNCPVSCKSCPDDERRLEALAVAVGVLQKTTGGTGRFDVPVQDVENTIQEAIEYMETVTLKKDLMELCKNEHEMCSIWAVAGECEANPGYMKKSCAPACKSCDYLSIEGRCPIDPNAPRAWEEGDLNRMFEKLTEEPYLSQYSVQILSSPATKGPWVITMDDVVSEEEAGQLIELGAVEGYTRSTDVGKMKADGSTEKKVSSGRTSTNAWCQHNCYKDPKAQDVIYRLSNLTGIDETNSEYLQLLKYEPGQYYKVHHDYIVHHLERQQGVRILTVYLYLNDVEEGGGTNFDQLGITVMPKRGRALLWPSVISSDPNKKDGRTTHQALPVEKGVKYGANAWFHMHDFKTPNKIGCQ